VKAILKLFLFAFFFLLSFPSFVLADEAAPAFVRTWGSSGSGDGELSFPFGLAVDSWGYIYVADTFNNRVQKFDSLGNFITKWGEFGAGNGQFIGPNCAAVDSSGNVYVSDLSDRIQKFDSSGNYLKQWGESGTGNGQFSSIGCMAVDASGNFYVADSGNNRIQKFDSSGGYLSKWGELGAGNGKFSGPYGVAVDSSGNVYVADTMNERVQKFDSSGGYLSKWGESGTGNSQFSFPYGVAVDSSGNVYVADTVNSRMQKFNSSGGYLTQWGELGTGNSQFNNPNALSVGPLGNIYIADTNNNRIQVFGSSTAPTGSVSPTGSYSCDPSSWVSLSISFVDSLESQAYMQMHVSNNSDFSTGSWETFSALKNWQHTGDTSNSRTVYVRFKNRNGDISSTYSANWSCGSSTATTTNINSNPNVKEGWKKEINVGPGFVGNNSLLTNNGLAAGSGIIVTNNISHDDLNIKVEPSSTIPPADNQIGSIMNLNAVSAFNGYPVLSSDSPFIIQMPIPQNISSKNLKIAYYDKSAKRWRILNTPNVVDLKRRIVANTTKLFTAYTLVSGNTANIIQQTGTLTGNTLGVSTAPMPSVAPVISTPAPKPISTPIPKPKRCFLFFCW